MSRIVVTGSTGFVGRTVVPELGMAGHRVVALARQAPAAGTGAAEVRIVADLGADVDWRSVLDGADAIVHLAGRAHVRRETEPEPMAAYRRIHVAATEALARAAAAAGVRRLVFASTVKVMGESSARPFVETDAPAPADPYALSKWEAERALAKVAAETGLEVVVLRPPLVYGPGVKGNFLSLMSAVARGLPLPLGAARNRRSLIHVANLARAIRLGVESKGAAGQCYLVRDGEDVSTAELVERLARALGTRARLVYVPEALLRLGGRLTGASARIGRLLDSLSVDDRKIRRLGFAPPVGLDRGLAETAAWFQNERSSGAIRGDPETGTMASERPADGV